MAGKIFEYAIIYHPKPRKVGEETVTDPSVLLGEIKQVVANGEQEVAIKAARDIPKDYEEKLEQVEIAVRPF